MLAQFIFNNILKTNPKSRLVYKIWFALRTLILKFIDPTVIYTYKKFKLKILFSHDLPFNLQQTPAYSQNLGVIAKQIAVKHSNLKVIDVGANIGDSVAIIHAQTPAEFLCIEGNPKFLGLLNQNLKQFKNTAVETCFVGEVEENVAAVNNLGTAFLQKSEEGIPVKTMQSVLQNHTQFGSAKLLKIDTDGFDNKIIRASKNFLESSNAAVFFEYDPYFLAKQNEIGTDIFEFFQNLNYQTAIIFDNYGQMLCSCRLSDKNLLTDLHNYFNQNGSKYMDILVLHQTDEDLVEPIKKQFA